MCAGAGMLFAYKGGFQWQKLLITLGAQNCQRSNQIKIHIDKLGL